MHAHRTTGAGASASPQPSNQPSAAESESKKGRLTDEQKARRNGAHRTFDLPYLAGKLTENAKNFGKFLVRRVGDRNSLCEDYSLLAKEFRCKGQTFERRSIVRWVQELEQAGLIWLAKEGIYRRIYISHYQAPLDEHQRQRKQQEEQRAAEAAGLLEWAMILAAMAERMVQSSQNQEPETENQEPETRDHEVETSSQDHADNESPGYFFEPETCDPGVPESVIRESHTTFNVKNPHPTDEFKESVKGVNPPTPQGGGGGKSSRKNRSSKLAIEDLPDTPAVRLMLQFGAENPNTIARHAHRTIENIQEAYDDARSRGPGILSVAGFMFSILEGQIPLKRRRKRAAAAATPPLNAAAAPPPSPYAALWHQVLDQLRAEIAPGEFETWLKVTSLLQLDDQAIVGTPNIFARERLEGHYLGYITRALQAATGGSAPAIRVVIDSTLVQGGAL